MKTEKEYKCPKCGALVWKGELKDYILNCPPFCPHCGALLPSKSAKVAVEVRDLNDIEKTVIKLASNLKYSYKPTDPRQCDGYNFDTIYRILCDDFLEKAKITKKKADSYDNILMFGIFGLIGVCFLLAIIFGCIAIFEDEPKTGIEVVKDKATGKYGIYNYDKDIQTVPFAYDSIALDGDYRAYILINGSKFGVADSSGNITIPCEMDSFHSVGNDMSIMYRNGMQGVYHRDGHIIIPCENQYVFWEKKPTEWTWKIPCDYVGNIIPVKHSNNSGWDIYDKSGHRVNLITYQEAVQSGEPDLIKVKINGLYGFVNSKGEDVSNRRPYEPSRFQEGIALYYDDVSIYAIDRSGNKVFSLPIGSEYGLFCEGRLRVKNKEGKWGYYDKTGKKVIDYQFEEAWGFVGDSAKISYQGHNGYVFKNGSIKLDAQ